MKKLSLLFFCIFFFINVPAQKKIIVHANNPGAEISPSMWGIFFEDINFGADGGLYAELIKNRSFEFPSPMMGWKETKQGGNGKLLVVNAERANPANPRYAHITIDTKNNVYSLSNEGFRGIGVHKAQSYQFSILAKKTEGDVKMKIELINSSGQKLANASIENFSSEWNTYVYSLTPIDSALKARLVLSFEGRGTIDVDMVSLFPKNTWKNRTNGLRSDLVQLLKDLQPGFVRFPGGCIVEGRDLANRYQWKNTVGSIAERKLIMNRWNVEFPRRSAPDYYQTFGLGFFEYFQLAEDIGSEPLPIINCGMACQYNSGEVASMNELDPFIQDALDLVEFANGAISTTWGKLRSDMGHPQPFHLKFLGIGNEQWDEQYLQRYKEFEKILKKRYPELQLVAAAGPSPDGARFDYAWQQLRLLQADLVDEHYYQPPEWFFKNANRYDAYDRKGPKVFAGEFAAHGKEEPNAESKNTWISALAEAAFMTGLERNADVVRMASYAPLLAHVEAWQWRPDLIWFDNLRVAGTANYYVQQLFSVHKGTKTVPALHEGQVLAGKDSLYVSSVIDDKKGELIIKLVSIAASTIPCEISIEGKKLKKNGLVHVLSSPDPLAYNTLDNPKKIQPIDNKIELVKNKISISLAPMSLNVIRIPY